MKKDNRHMSLPEEYDSLDSFEEAEREYFWEMFRSRSWKGWLALGISIIVAILLLVFNVTASSKAPEDLLAKFQSLIQTEKVAEDAAETEEAKEEVTEEVAAEEAETEEVATEEVAAEEVVTEEVVAETEEASSESTEEVVTEEIIWHFYNLDLQDDGDKKNDYNFGPSPIMENISLDKVKTAIKGKKASDTIKVEDIIEMLDANQLKAEQIKRMYDDPKLGAADMAWMDSIAGTRYLGTFYSAAKEQWDVAMNDAADAWIQDEESYNQTLNAFENWLDAADEVKIEYRNKGLTDQMYMNPYTPSGIPDIIVMETSNHEGWFIVYKFTIKETKTFEVAYRIDCGFQPTNVAKIMKVKAQKNPNNQTKKKSEKKSEPKKTETVTTNPTPSGEDSNPKPSGDDPDPKPSGDDDKDPNPNPDPVKPDPDPDPDPEPGPTPPDPTPPDPTPPGPTPPDPDPDPDPDKPKDPSQGTQEQPNDDPGPGPDTNGGDHSSAEQDTNSGNMSQDEYKQAQEENRSANETSREGGESNKPSTPTESETKVDNNGDEGTGNGGIDEPTKVQDSSVSNDEAGDSWDGPPD